MKVKEEVQQLKQGFQHLFHTLKFGTKEEKKKQIPNLLTLSRGVVAPLFILPVMLSGHFITGAILTALLATTDALDGHFARKYQAFSEFGRQLDPICDKIFAGSLILPLLTIIPLQILPILALEGVIATVNISSHLNGNQPKTVIIGKVKTTSLFLTVIMAYFTTHFPLLVPAMNTLLISTASLQVFSSIEYGLAYFKKESQKDKSQVEETVTVALTDFENPEIEVVKQIAQPAIELLSRPSFEPVDSTSLSQNPNGKQKILKRTIEKETNCD